MNLACDESECDYKSNVGSASTTVAVAQQESKAPSAMMRVGCKYTTEKLAKKVTETLKICEECLRRTLPTFEELTKSLKLMCESLKDTDLKE